MKIKLSTAALGILATLLTWLNAGMCCATCCAISSVISNAIATSGPGSNMVCAKSVAFSGCSLEKLVDAIADVESGNNPAAIGDRGRALGAWQLHKCAVDHVNLKFHTTYVWPRDALNPITAREIVKVYLRICGWGKRSTEETTRRYNGGYKHWQSEAAGRYWQRVQRCLK